VSALFTDDAMPAAGSVATAIAGRAAARTVRPRSRRARRGWGRRRLLLGPANNRTRILATRAGDDRFTQSPRLDYFNHQLRGVNVDPSTCGPELTSAPGDRKLWLGKPSK